MLRDFFCIFIIKFRPYNLLSMKCKICNNDVTLRSMAMHLKWNHSLNTKEYISKFGEFRPKNIKKIQSLKSSKLKCLECNMVLKDQRGLMFHITKKHKISHQDYILKHYFNNIHPLCKCGCGEKTSFLKYDKKNWFAFYIKGHWDWVKPGYNTHSESTKKQMRKSAIKRIENEKGLFKGISKAEKELLSFIKSQYKGRIISNDIELLEGKEIDIYLPDLNLAIEFNGTYYHSDLFKKDKQYHLKKTKECNALGVKLIHIWDSDWVFKKDIIKSILKNQLKLTTDRIYARKCIIKPISNVESVKFLKENHLQGNAVCKYSLGLFYKEQLVSVMTFSKLRKNLKQNNIEGHFELLRFCNKLNINIIGGASKLFKYFIKEHNPIKIVSYANRDWSDGGLYKKLNMNSLPSTTPGYHWYKSKIKYNRFNFRKDLLVKQGEDPNLTEYEIMLKNGFYKVWNTGNLKFEWNRDQILPKI
jgi:very-short-patch-repair endonuclease